MSFLSRTRLVLGDSGVKKLGESSIAIFGIGGVGSFAAEALGRCGLGELTIVDYDLIDESNINRQIHSNSKTIGKAKVQIMKERLRDINPNIMVNAYKEKYTEGTSDKLLSKDYDYVIDAIDMVSSKIDLIVRCTENNIPIVSAMGAGNKIDPTMFEVADIYDTSICPLARVMRRELRKRGVKTLKVVYSKERQVRAFDRPLEKLPEIPTGSVSYVPSVMGMILASVVVKEIINVDR